MILLIVFGLITLFMILLTLVIIALTGGVGIIAFADVIVCTIVMVWITKKIYNRIKNR